MKQFQKLVIFVLVILMSFPMVTAGTVQEQTAGKEVVVSQSERTDSVRLGRSSTESSQSVKIRYVTVDTLNVRNKPSTEGKVIEKKHKNDKVSVLTEEDRNGWVEIDTDLDSKAYVKASYLSEEPVPENTSKSERKNSSVSGKASSSNQSTASQSSSDASWGGVAWIPASGSCYHSRNNCGRMNPAKATMVTEQQALAMGYSPCKKCH